VGFRFLLGVSLLSLACNGPAPARTQVELPEMVLSTSPVRVLVWRWDDKNRRTEALPSDTEFSVQPKELADVAATGHVSCKKTGDAKVTATVSSVSSSGVLRCRLVHRLEAPEDLGRIELTKGAVTLDVAAYTKEGQRLDDVPLKISTKNSQLARPDGDRLVPLAVGEAKVEVRAGDVGREFAVKIVKRMMPEPIPIEKDTRLHFTLDPGRYELSVELEQEKKLSMEWLRAPYCNYSAVAKVHTQQCLLQVKGGVHFDNPAYLNSGATTVSHDGVTLLLIGE
jgi:hypothetical protein